MLESSFLRVPPCWLVTLALALALPACGARSLLRGEQRSDAGAFDATPPGDPGAGPFAGTWTGDAVTMTTMGDSGTFTAMGRLVVTIANSAEPSMTVTVMGEGTPSGVCVFQALRNGPNAVLVPMQPCRPNPSFPEQVWTVSGTLSVDAASSTLTATFEGPITVATDGGSVPLGTARIQFSGSRS